MVDLLRRIVVPHFDDEELNRRAFNLNVILLVTFIVMSLGILAMLLQIGQRPLSYVIPNMVFIAMAALILGLCYYLSRHGRVQAGSTIFIVMMTVACVGAVVFGGTLGALPVILVIPITAAGVTVGGGISLALAGLSVAALIVTGSLEINGVIKVAYPAPQMTILLNMFDVSFGLFFVTLSIWLAGYSLQQALGRTRQSVVEVNHYREELEKSLAAEQVIRDRLQRSISDYTTFLEQIGQGNYAARLPLTQEEADLVTLAQQINKTVDTLVAVAAQSETARQEAEAVQRHYQAQAWRDYVKTGHVTDFEVAQPNVSVPRAKLRSAFEKALTQRRTMAVASDDGQEVQESSSHTAMVAPITLRGEVIGALSLGRTASASPLTSDEQAVIEAVVERLALAADNIRLIDETQRRAAREQLVGEVTVRMRESLDVNTVLQTAVREMRQALGLAQVEVRLDTHNAD